MSQSASRLMPVLLGDMTSAPPSRPLHCPGCGGEWVHGGTLHEQDVTDDYTCPLGTRGSWLSTDCWCESCSVTFRLVIGFHKGQTFAGYVIDSADRGRNVT
jgi:hypothetical protein